MNIDKRQQKEEVATTLLFGRLLVSICSVFLINRLSISTGINCGGKILCKSKHFGQNPYIFLPHTTSEKLHIYPNCLTVLPYFALFCLFLHCFAYFCLIITWPKAYIFPDFFESLRGEGRLKGRILTHDFMKNHLP